MTHKNSTTPARSISPAKAGVYAAAKRREISREILIAFFVFLLSACGGGGGSTSLPDTTMQAPDTTDETPDTMDTKNEMSDEIPMQTDTAETFALRALGARWAHSQGTDGYRGQGVTVSMVDRGVLHTHPDLTASIISLTNFSNHFTGHTHGTGSAGVVAGISTGIAPDAKMIFPLTIALLSSTQIHMQNVGDPNASAAAITALANFYADAYTDVDIVGVFGAGNNTLNTVPNFGEYPTIRTDIREKLLIATAVDITNTVIAEYANRCGDAMRWCISAFDSVWTTAINPTKPHRYYCCTSVATPQVAGALAVLKSAADELLSEYPQMTLMTFARTVLLETATPLYDENTDGIGLNRQIGDANPALSAVYGWGLVNISAGIVHLRDIAADLERMKQMAKVRLGGAAKFAAANKFSPATENAFRFWGGYDSQNANKWTGIATREYGGVSGFAEYGSSDMKINSFLANGEIRGVESENWTAGFRYANIFRHNDNLQISARQESPINSGDLILHYSFGKQIVIPLKQKPATIWTVAYSGEINRWIPAFAGMTGRGGMTKGKFGIAGGEWTAAAEWNERTNDTGFSFAADFRF